VVERPSGPRGLRGQVGLGVERSSGPRGWRGQVGLSGGEAKWAVVERQSEWAQVVERPSEPSWWRGKVSGPRWWRGQVSLGGGEAKVLRNLCPRRHMGPRG
jgi:hypothetical protein